jgi:hypothetical protein
MSSVSIPDVPKAIVTERSGETLHRSQVILEAMTPFAQVLVRSARTYVQCVLGFLPLALIGQPALEKVGVIIPPGSFLDALGSAAGLALAPTVISFLQNLLEILARFDEKFPKARA